MRRGRTKSTSHWPGTPSRTRFLWAPTQRTGTTCCGWNAVFFSANTLVVLAPGSVPKWPECVGKFSLTHCRSCAAKDTKNEYVFNAASCGCGDSRDHSNSIICNACPVGNNLSKDCSREGCGSKRHGEGKYCKPCSVGNNMSKDFSMEGFGSKRHAKTNTANLVALRMTSEHTPASCVKSISY